MAEELIVVRFHGGFLDGETVRSDDVRRGMITDYWNAEAVFLVTKGEVGATMFGICPEGWKLFSRHASRGVVSADMDHAYRVTASHREGLTLTIDLEHQPPAGT